MLKKRRQLKQVFFTQKGGMASGHSRALFFAPMCRETKRKRVLVKNNASWSVGTRDREKVSKEKNDEDDAWAPPLAKPSWHCLNKSRG